MLQQVDDRKWARLAEEIDLDYRKVKATRGNIYSHNGSLLATSVPIYEVRWDSQVKALTDEEFNIEKIAQLVIFSIK